MNKKPNIVIFGTESITPIEGGLYHGKVDINGKQYHNYDIDPLVCLDYIFDVKNRKGAGKFSDVDISNMYTCSDVRITIEDWKYTVVLNICGRVFILETYGEYRCLQVLKALGAKRSKRAVESFRASLARYAWSLIMYGDTLRPESSNEEAFQEKSS